MDPQVQASFIPKKPLTVERRRGGGLLFLLAMLFFIGSVIAGGAAFAYENFLNQTLTNQSKSLKSAEGAFNPGAIEDLVRLDSRIIQSQNLLDTHVAVSALLDLLSQATLEQVQLTSLQYSTEADGTGKLTVDGVSNDFQAVALQSDEFGKVKALSNVIFSDFTVGERGRVTFTVNAKVDGSLLQYKRKILETVPTQ